jgi:hypothetical protein
MKNSYFLFKGGRNEKRYFAFLCGWNSEGDEMKDEYCR